MATDRDTPIPSDEPAPGLSSRLTSRRQALAWLGAAGAAMAAAACGGGSGTGQTTAAADGATTSSTAGSTVGSTAAPASTAATTATTAVAVAPATCVLTPEMTEGPYYIAGETIRADVTDGKPGVPLALTLVVLDATTCSPIPGATVEIWHADAGGVYSGFGSGASSRTFLRGVQIADAGGKVTFKTIYPGWYQGRATHIHLKALVDGTTHTSQLFFPEAANSAVYAVAPYSTHTGTRTLNAQDGIFSGGGSMTTLAPTGSPSAYAAALNLGVRR
ncbi:MAG: intradiol ring-cleavage dioxygenase [Actinomycetota bacterium]|nr:intradiol ring-cleavage dioxygenase [Actinomycetota bacterium]